MKNKVQKVAVWRWRANSLDFDVNRMNVRTLKHELPNHDIDLINIGNIQDGSLDCLGLYLAKLYSLKPPHW